MNHGSNEKCSLHTSTPPVFPWSTPEEMSAQPSNENSSNEKSSNTLNSKFPTVNFFTSQSSPQNPDLMSLQPVEVNNITSKIVQPAKENINIANEKAFDPSSYASSDENSGKNDDRIPESHETEQQSDKEAFGWEHSSAKNTFPTISLLGNSNVTASHQSTSDIAFGWKHSSAKNYDLPAQSIALNAYPRTTGHPIYAVEQSPVITPGRMRPPLPPHLLTPRVRKLRSSEYYLSERIDNWPSAERLAQLDVHSLDPATNYDLEMERHQLNEDEEIAFLTVIDDPATILNPKNFFMFKITVKDAPKTGVPGGNGVKIVDKYGLTKLDYGQSSNFCPKSSWYYFEEIKTKKPDPKTGQRLHPNELKANYKTIYKAHHRFRRSLCNWRLAWLYHIQQHHEKDGQVQCYHCGIKLGKTRRNSPSNL